MPFRQLLSLTSKARTVGLMFFEKSSTANMVLCRPMDAQVTDTKSAIPNPFMAI
jgi:hypothetical protein